MNDCFFDTLKGTTMDIEFHSAPNISISREQGKDTCAYN